MEVPDNLKYSKEHEWVREDGNDVVTIGITFYAQDALGDIVYVETPAVGTTVEQGEELGVVESVKAVSDIYAPVSGNIVEVNEILFDTPEVINENPYGDGWLVKIEVADPDELDDLLDADGYTIFLDGEDAD